MALVRGEPFQQACRPAGTVLRGHGAREVESLPAHALGPERLPNLIGHPFRRRFPERDEPSPGAHLPKAPSPELLLEDER